MVVSIEPIKSQTFSGGSEGSPGFRCDEVPGSVFRVWGCPLGG